MAESTSSSGSTVTVMDESQVTSLISSLVTPLTEIKTALDTLNTNLANVKTTLDTVVSKLDTTNTNLEGIKEQIGDSGELDSELVENVGNIATNLTSLEKIVNTRLTSVPNIIADSVTGLKTTMATIPTAVNSVASKLEVDINSNFHLDYDDTITGVKSLAYIEASNLERSLKNEKEADERANDGSSDDSESQASEAEIKAVNDAIVNAYKEVFNGVTIGEDIYPNISSFSYGIDEANRIVFQKYEDFVYNRFGLPFDFTRHFVERFGTITDVNVEELAILAFDSTIKTSTSEDSDTVDRMKTWKDYRIIQTCVIITNNLSNETYVYMPIESDVAHMVDDVFKDHKKATDYIVSAYQEIIGEEHIGLAFVPVSSIERGVYNEEYRTTAKHQKPIREYM